MRVLLARRFRGNRNKDNLLEEEGEDQQTAEGEEKQEEIAIVSQLSQEPEKLQQVQTKTFENREKSQLPVDPIEPLKNENVRNRFSKQPLSVVSSQQQQTSSPAKKRRLSKGQQKEVDYSLRRRQVSASSIKEESSLLDSKPRARDTRLIEKNTKQTSSFALRQSKNASATGGNTISKEATLSVSATKPTHNKMVSGNPGRNQNRRHAHSREDEEEEHILNWQYNNTTHQQPHPIVQSTESALEIISQPVPADEFDCPLENDPASARGDVSSASPERENHDNRKYPNGSPSLAREESPIYEQGETSSISSNGRNMPRLALGSERRPLSSQPMIQNWNNTIHKKKKANTAAEELQFRSILKKERGLEIREQEGDGNCLFRAISLQVYGDPSMHGDVRKQCMDHMERDQEHFSQFVTGEPFLQYVARTRQDGVHGNNTEIQASSELFNRPIEVFTPENGSSPINIFHAEYKTGDVPIRLSYHDGNHYNAVIDPLMPTAGLGLGLPGLKPGYADKMQMAKAVAESMDAAASKDETELKQVLKASQLEYKNNNTDSDDDLQRAIKESQLSAEHMSSNNALSLSDMDATYFELEQAALERSLQSFSQKEGGKKQRAEPKTIREDHKAAAVVTATATSAATASLPCPSQESIPLAAAAASSPAASAASHGESSSPTQPQRLLPVDEYPSSVQELVVNGFPLSAVVRAFDLVGDNFDHMLSLCLNSNR